MLFKFQVGTKVWFGKNSLLEHKDELAALGKRAVIVTGRNSGRSSGAVDDVRTVLSEMGIESVLFDRIENNPSLDTVKTGGNLASEFGADFIIGIGGGSPLDAAKAIAVLAVNDMEPVELYRNVFKTRPLPVAAIPTTAGTGSEVNPYSILTRRDMEIKKSFGNEQLFPKVAFIDARYTENLPRGITVNTSIDAFTHALEGYITKRSMIFSDMLAVESIKVFGECLPKLLEWEMSFEVREKLLYMSMVAGMVITHTGTTVLHAMGYSLTYYRDIPHGKANGVLLPEYLKFVYGHAKDKIDNALGLIGMKDIDGFGEAIRKMMPVEEKFTGEDMKLFALSALKQNSVVNTPRPVTEQDIVDIYAKTLL